MLSFLFKPVGSIPHAAGLPSPTEPKMFPRAILLAPNGQPLLVPQPLVQGDRGMVSIASPYLTQASIFYAPHFFSPHQLAAMQHTTPQQNKHLTSTGAGQTQLPARPSGGPSGR